MSQILDITGDRTSASPSKHSTMASACLALVKYYKVYYRPVTEILHLKNVTTDLWRLFNAQRSSSKLHVVKEVM